MIRFSQVRNDLDNGDVLLVRHARWLLAPMIRGRTSSVYSHVALIFKIEGSLFAYEATWPQGVRLVPLRHWLHSIKGDVDLFRTDPAAVNTWKMLWYALDHLGQSYSVWQLIASWGVVTRLLRRFKKKPKDVNTKQWICSEIVSSVFLAGGYRHDEPFEPSETDPGMVARFTCLRRAGQLVV